MATQSPHVDKPDPGPPVAAYMRVVANGVAKNGRIKATLIVSPQSPVDGVATNMSLATWPGDIVRHLASLTKPDKFPLWYNLHDPGNDVASAVRLNKPAFSALADQEKGLIDVDALWRKAITDTGAPYPWQMLLADVDQSANGRKSSADLQGCYQSDPKKADLLDNGAILAQSHNPAQTAVVKGVVPNPQTSYAVDTVAARAQRVTRKLAIGPYLPGDQDVNLSTSVPDLKHPEVFAAQRKAALLQRLTDAVNGTDTDRQNSKAHFDTVKAALGATAAAAPAAPPAEGATPAAGAAPVACAAPAAAAAPPAASLPIAPVTQVLGKQAPANSPPAPSRAGHVYGSWAQWSHQHKASSDEIKKAALPGAPPAKPKGPPPDPQASLLSVYYSLQGDPILSRLFGFAFDIEFDIPNAIETGGDIWLAAGDAPNFIWTKARYVVSDGDDKTRRFWPAPRFEAINASVALSREQIHGVFDLGQGYDQENPQPRYSLTSLAVRGAVSESLDGIETVDKGERHQTIGWTLLDSGRAAQTARDLAVANHQREARSANKAVVLYAEELTIGRRLDVLAVGPKQKSVQWRSLMYRFVEFPNLLAGAKDRLDTIVADRLQKGRILDEAAFQLMARSMPVVGDQAFNLDGSRNVEAVVEEAFQSWDGTPLAALACKSTANGSGSDVLPVKRAYDLPASDFPNLRPPPLRYGVGYVFSIRSEFLGGGSPSLEEATRWHQAQGGKTTLPPSDKTGLKPHRFLRHEAIAAPILMLPEYLVAGSNGEMGFESPGRAVVRTATASDKSAPNGTASAPGPDYITLAQRARPESTMRVFIAPRAGLDFCARHGVFDNPATAAQRLGGGLLDVEFDVGPKVQGFPVAVVKRNTGFNADRLIYSREPGPPGQKPTEGDTLGATIFHPKAPVKREAGRGYLPDPMAEVMSLRLRITGSDRYLVGDVPVELYPNGVDAGYPNALPVVVKVEKTTKQRSRPAKSVNEVLLGDPNAIVRIREGGGEPGSDGSGVGVRARYLRIVLGPGEQFDLEATCLPSRAKLAQWFALPEAIGVQNLLASNSPQAATALCASCGDGAISKMTKAIANAKPATLTGLGGYAPPDDSGLGAIAQELLDCVQKRWQLSELAGTTTLHVEHAISAPQNAVSLAEVAILRPDPSSPVDQLPVTSAAGSPTLLLTGELLVDLEQVDAVDIVAEVVNPNGAPFDDPARGRGVLAKRTGHWPTVQIRESERKYKRKRAVFGFDVAADGKTTLLPQVITLLRIQNLPDPRAAVNPPTPAPKIFLDPDPSTARLTRLNLGALDWAARNAKPIEIPVASDGSPSGKAAKTRTIAVTRPHEITDTRARNVKLYAVAISRFARSFETAPMFSADGNEHLLHRRQPLHDSDQRKTGSSVKAWSNATARSAPAGPRTPTPFFAIKRSAELDRVVTVQTLVRKCGVRLRFDRGMFSAGQGERIGIVLWPPNIVNQNPVDLEENKIEFVGRTMTLKDFIDADLGDGGQYISRWGGDPIRSDPTPQKGWFMPPTAFACLNPAEAGEPQAHDPKYVGSVNMPIAMANQTGAADGTPDANAITFMPVALLTFEPYFDIDAEEWFVDVAMDGARATDPFIRLGLVRYQPNAVNDQLQVSTPVRVWTQLPPRRTLCVQPRTAKNGDIELNAVVRGQASDGIKPLPHDAAKTLFKDTDHATSAARWAVWNRLQVPKMVLKIVHETEDGNFGRRQTNVFPSKTTDFDIGKIEDGETVWSTCVTIPRSRVNDLGAGQFVAIVEETEERLPATYPNEPIKLTDLLTADVVQKSGPRFIGRIPFFEKRQ